MIIELVFEQSFLLIEEYDINTRSQSGVFPSNVIILSPYQDTKIWG